MQGVWSYGGWYRTDMRWVFYGNFCVYVQRSYDISLYYMSIVIIGIFYVYRGIGVNQVRSGPASWNWAGAWGAGC